MTVDDLFESAQADHRAGRFSQAEDSCRRILAENPAHAGALHLRGLLLARENRLDEAIENLRQAAALAPQNAACLIDLSAVFTMKGQFAEAIESCRRAIAINPDIPEAHRNLANALKDSGQPEEAIIAARQAIRLRRQMPVPHAILGDALNRVGRHDDAIIAFRHAIALQPDLAIAHNNLGIAFGRKRQFDQAIDSYRRAIAFKPQMAEAHNNLGNALKFQGKTTEAVASYRNAIRIQPTLADAHTNLGVLLRENWQFDDALVELQAAADIAPNYAEAFNNLSGGFHDLGDLDKAIAAYRRALELKPDLSDAHSNLLFAMTSHPAIDPTTTAAEHRRWAEIFAAPVLGNFAHTNPRLPEKRLRIGYLSPDFRRHSVGFFFLPLLANHNRASFEIFCYASVSRSDDFTESMRKRSDGWRDIVAVNDDQAADMIRADEIDILVDLAGHTSGNRLLVMARKPAPVQVTYLGYPNTTGISAIDFRLTDALADPPGLSDELNVEKLHRLPTCAWCYQPPPQAPPPARSSASPITFGCFNAYAKINDSLLALWAKLLQEVPESRLLLKSAGAAQPSSRSHLARSFASLGIAPDRIDTLSRLPDLRDHLSLYNRVDIALDTFPYHGTTTTCEALWMGVPVVALAGTAHLSRVGVSLLTNANLPELIAQSPDEYVHIAAHLAADRPRLSDLRQNLRAQLQASPLLDAPRFAADVESAYRHMWRTHREK